MKRLFLVPCFLSVFVGVAYAEWTPLITSSDFTGVQTDLLTVASGVLGLSVIVLGLFILIRAMMH